MASRQSTYEPSKKDVEAIDSIKRELKVPEGVKIKIYYKNTQVLHHSEYGSRQGTFKPIDKQIAKRVKGAADIKPDKYAIPGKGNPVLRVVGQRDGGKEFTLFRQERNGDTSINLSYREQSQTKSAGTEAAKDSSKPQSNVEPVRIVQLDDTQSKKAPDIPNRSQNYEDRLAKLKTLTNNLIKSVKQGNVSPKKVEVAKATIKRALGEIERGLNSARDRAASKIKVVSQSESPAKTIRDAAVSKAASFATAAIGKMSEAANAVETGAGAVQSNLKKAANWIDNVNRNTQTKKLVATATRKLESVEHYIGGSKALVGQNDNKIVISRLKTGDVNIKLHDGRNITATIQQGKVVAVNAPSNLKLDEMAAATKSLESRHAKPPAARLAQYKNDVRAIGKTVRAQLDFQGGNTVKGKNYHFSKGEGQGVTIARKNGEVLYSSNVKGETTHSSLTQKDIGKFKELQRSVSVAASQQAEKQTAAVSAGGRER